MSIVYLNYPPEAMAIGQCDLGWTDPSGGKLDLLEEHGPPTVARGKTDVSVSPLPGLDDGYYSVMIGRDSLSRSSGSSMSGVTQPALTSIVIVVG
jgi:hypothetical protein